ncbi:MAG: hypothetical protein GKR87_09255 [Kiritimatiellae bacterium]|nr:hypothetical protein [Kiritimatiellia bacterium]
MKAEDANVIVESDSYLSRNQAQGLILTATLTPPLSMQPFDEDQMIWQLSPPEAGTFVSSGSAGNVGEVVRWKQATDYVSEEVDDVVMTLSVPGALPEEFKLTIFNINSTSGILTPNTTNTFMVEYDKIEPKNANIDKVLDILNHDIQLTFIRAHSPIPNDSIRKLRTRGYTHEYNQILYQDYDPDESIQTSFSQDNIIKEAAFQKAANGVDLEVRVVSGNTVGDVNIVWESHKADGSSINTMHREHIGYT